jgi:hypothetical protein
MKWMGQSVSAYKIRQFEPIKTIHVLRSIAVAVAALSICSCAAQPPKCTCVTATTSQPTPLPMAASPAQPADGNTVTTGYFYGVEGGVATWRTCGTDNVITVQASKIVSAIRGGTCAGIVFGFNPEFTITVRP